MNLFARIRRTRRNNAFLALLNDIAAGYERGVFHNIQIEATPAGIRLTSNAVEQTVPLLAVVMVREIERGGQELRKAKAQIQPEWRVRLGLEAGWGDGGGS